MVKGIQIVDDSIELLTHRKRAPVVLEYAF
jgi:hypothetical protein